NTTRVNDPWSATRTPTGTRSVPDAGRCCLSAVSGEPIGGSSSEPLVVASIVVGDVVAAVSSSLVAAALEVVSWAGSEGALESAASCAGEDQAARSAVVAAKLRPRTEKRLVVILPSALF